MKKVLLGLGVLGFLSPTLAMAEGFFVGASYGRSELNVSSSDKGDLRRIGFDDIDETDYGSKIFAGYRVNRNFAAEVFYADLGEARFSDGFDTVRIKADTFGIAALGMAPINENVDLYAKLGFHGWDAEADVIGIPGKLDDDGTDLMYGAGINYTVNKISVRIEYERYELDDEDVDLFSGGIAYNF